MTKRIFISYSQADRAKAEQICDGLEARGLKCWIAPRNILPGVKDWSGPIVRALRNGAGLVLVLSNNTSSSKQVEREVHIADQNYLTIVPVRIEPITELNDQLSYFVGTRHYLNAYEGSFEDSLDRLAEVFRHKENEDDPLEGEHKSIRPPVGRTRWSVVSQYVTARWSLIAASVVALMIGAVALAALFGPIKDRLLHSPPRNAEIASELPADNKVIIQGKRFLESTIVAELMATMIEEEAKEAIEVQVEHFAGENKTLFASLLNGAADIIPDYTGTLLVQHLKLPLDDIRKGDHKDDDWVRAMLNQSKYGQKIEWLDGFGFYSNYNIVMLKSRIDELIKETQDMSRPAAARQIRTISDLAAVARNAKLAGSPLTIGMEPTFWEGQRLDGFYGLKKAYPGLDSLEVDHVLHDKKFDELEKRKFDVTNAFSLDPPLHDPNKKADFVILQDDRKFFTDYYGAPVVHRETLNSHPEIRRALGKLAGKVSTADMEKLVASVHINNIDINEIADGNPKALNQLKYLCRNFLEHKGLVQSRFAGSNAPVWSLNGTEFVGEPVPLTWTYQFKGPFDDSNKHKSICFKIQRASDKKFTSDAKTIANCWPPEKSYRDNINGTRYYRVRALDRESKMFLSGWSDTIRITQFVNALMRIRKTGQLRLYMADAQEQDIFKWVAEKGTQGVDIELARHIRKELSKSKVIQQNLEMSERPIRFDRLLVNVQEGRADFVVSTVTKTPDREKKYDIRFSDGYFCTTHALLYRANTDEQASAIREMLAGKVVAAQYETTNSQLARALLENAGDAASFKLVDERRFIETTDLVHAIRRQEIDYAIVDTAFARGAQLDERRANEGVEVLTYREFTRDDMPPSWRNGYKQEYSVAVRRTEIELLNIINKIIAEAKADGSLKNIYKKALCDFESTYGLEHGSHMLQEPPWECGPLEKTDLECSSSYPPQDALSSAQPTKE